MARGSQLHRSIHERISGPLLRPHQHREPTGNYTPIPLTFASFGTPPGFNLEVNYDLVHEDEP